MLFNLFKKKGETSTSIVEACKSDSLFELLKVIQKDSKKFNEAVSYLKKSGNINLLMKLLFTGGKNERNELMRLLMAYNGDPTELDRLGKDGINPLHLICGRKGAELYIRVLANSRANLDVVDSEGRSALLISSERCLTETVKMLLNNGARDVNRPDSLGWTPLHFACQNGNYEITRMLVAVGANVNAISNDHYMPIHVTFSALQMSKIGQNPGGIALDPNEIVKCMNLLIKNGADMDYKCALGYSMNDLLNK